MNFLISKEKSKLFFKNFQNIYFLIIFKNFEIFYVSRKVIRKNLSQHVTSSKLHT